MSQNPLANQSHAIDQYKSVNLESASNEQIVVMLFEATVQLQQDARKAFAAEEFGVARERLRKVRDIVAELMVALDHDVAPDLATNLSDLYTWLLAELGRAGLEKDASILDGTIKVTENLLEGWKGAFHAEP